MPCLEPEEGDSSLYRVQKVTAAALGAAQISIINHEDECFSLVLFYWDSLTTFLYINLRLFCWWVTGSSEVKGQLISPGLGSLGSTGCIVLLSAEGE